jgi:hypothetical protein
MRLIVTFCDGLAVAAEFVPVEGVDSGRVESGLLAATKGAEEVAAAGEEEGSASSGDIVGVRAVAADAGESEASIELVAVPVAGDAEASEPSGNGTGRKLGEEVSSIVAGTAFSGVGEDGAGAASSARTGNTARSAPRAASTGDRQAWEMFLS